MAEQTTTTRITRVGYYIIDPADDELTIVDGPYSADDARRYLSDGWAVSYHADADTEASIVWMPGDELATATTSNGMPLIPHDGIEEGCVCRACGKHNDPASDTYAAAVGQDGGDLAQCMHCGGYDTAWLYAHDDD